MVLLLAIDLLKSTEPVPLVPLLLPVQRLAVLLRGARPEEREADLLRFFIEKEYSDNETTRRMLLQASVGHAQSHRPPATAVGIPPLRPTTACAPARTLLDRVREGRA